MCDLYCNIAAPDRAWFSGIHGSAVLCSTNHVGTDGSYLFGGSKKDFAKSLREKWII